MPLARPSKEIMNDWRTRLGKPMTDDRTWKNMQRGDVAGVSDKVWRVARARLVRVGAPMGGG